MYLPQFHRTPENDMWWGEGFTDWVSARNGQPLFEGHYQPHKPKNGIYYDLMDVDTLKWQAELMKKYSVDGLCFYHYWFKDGKKILEKPAELLLSNKDIDMPFCFSWANETWARSWANIKGSNTWSNVLESKNGDNNCEDAILLEQGYGDRRDWEEHFSYLLHFFKDNRYITVDEKPVFMIYKAGLIGSLKEMIAAFREMAVANGLSGLYVIGGFAEGIAKGVLDAVFYPEPVHANRIIMQGKYDNGIKRLSYTDIWGNILAETGSDNVYYGGFVSYDDTPRRGIEGVVVENTTPELFGEFLTQLMAKNAVAGNDITFINAWNEWGEGMHLEPDEKYGEAFLEKIKPAKECYKEFVSYFKQQKPHDLEDRNEKHELYLNDLDLWMGLREKKIAIEDWLIENGYRKIAIYGYGIMGRHLETELNRSDNVQLEFIVDRQKNLLHTNVCVYEPTEKLPPIDVIIVASYYFFDSAKKVLPQGIEVVSLGSILHMLDTK